MVFIIGGAYQGKLDYAKNRFSLENAEIYMCSEENDIEFGAKCIYRIEEYTLRCVRSGADAAEVFKAHRGEWESSILICRDIFCGVVPIEKEMRLWREMTGRLCAYLSSEADSVVRIFCGLEQKLK